MSLGIPRFLRSFRNTFPPESAKSLVTWLPRAGAALYEVGARGRRGLYQKGWLAPRRLPAPVISVGNLSAGGTGKTPLTAYLARLFQEQGVRVIILSRGYGGQRRKVTCLSNGKHLYYQPPEVGEEAYWLAQSLPGIPVYTGPCRYDAGLAAWENHRPELFLLDDGFQHFQLARDLDIVLLDAARPFGNSRLLPAGPLREPRSTLAEADILLLTRFDPNRHQDRVLDLERAFPGQEVFTAAIEPTTVRRFPGGEEHPLKSLRRLPVLAFAGLARPQVFQNSLRDLGVDLRGFGDFPDHYAYSPEDLAILVREARARGAGALITTSKDWARLGRHWPEDLPLWVLEIAARVEPEPAFQACLAAALGWKMRRSALFGLGSPHGSLFRRAGFSPASISRRAGIPPGATVQRRDSQDNYFVGERAPRPPSWSRRDAPLPLPPQARRAYRKLTLNGRAPRDAFQIRRILLRAPNWVGDAVMSLPVLAGLTGRFPTAQITVLAAPRVAPLFAGQPGVAEVLPYPAGPKKGRFLLGLKGKFDLALALPNSLEAALGFWLTRTPHRLGYAADGRTPLLTLALKGRKHLQGLHQVYYYLGLLEALGPVGTFFPPRLYLSEAEMTAAGALFQENGTFDGLLIGLAPGAAYGPAKRWPAQRFAAVADLLQKEFQADLVLLGGPADREAAAEVQRLGQGDYVNLAGKTTLRQALAVLSQLNVLITNDSGLMHAAAALEVPLVALFGSTDPGATGPFTSRATVIHHPLPCGPCLKRTCDDQDYACLNEITVDEVAEAGRGWLEDMK